MLPTANLGPQLIEPSRQADDFKGRLKVTNPTVLHEAKFNNDKQPLTWNESTAGSGSTTYNQYGSNIDLEVTTSSGDKVIRQSKQYIPYGAGKTQSINLTGVFGSPTAGIRKQLGYYDDRNGVLWRQTENGDFEIVIRSYVGGSVSETTYTQSNWNRDTLDGTDDTDNPSGLNLDNTNAQLFIIDSLWLGVGGVRFGVYINGRIVWVHRDDVGNTQPSPWSGEPSLPLRYEIENVNGSSSPDSLKQICSTVISESGSEEKRTVQRNAFTNLDSAVSISTTKEAILGIRPKSTYKNKPNRKMILPDGANVSIQGEEIVWSLRYNADIDAANTTWTSKGPDSAAEFSRDITLNSFGYEIDSGFIAADKNIPGSISEGTTKNKITVARGIDHTIDADADNLVLVTKSLTSATTGFGCIIWRE